MLLNSPVRFQVHQVQKINRNNQGSVLYKIASLVIAWFFCKNKSKRVYASRYKNRLTLSCEMLMISPKRQQLLDFGSLNKKLMVIGNVQRAVGGQLGFLVMVSLFLYGFGITHTSVNM